MKTNKIREIDYSIAFVSGQGNIYINKHLKAYNKKLYDRIIEHEKSHDLGPYNTTDLKEDMSIDYFPLKDKIKFCLKHPKGFLFLSPVIVTEDEIMVSGIGIFKWGVVLSIVAFILLVVF